MAYWLFKSEPDVFSFDDLRAAPDQTTGWDGVRNYQARNYLRDDVRPGDHVFFYHSNADPPAIAGLAMVVAVGQPDPTAFDPASDHYDPKSDPQKPTWYQVSVKAVRPLTGALDLRSLRQMLALEGLELIRKGSRLSIQPVSDAHAEILLSLSDPVPVTVTVTEPRPPRRKA